jgi:hypothetical protein
MNKTIAALSLLVPLLLTAAGVVAASTGAARGVRSASGSGHVFHRSHAPHTVPDHDRKRTDPGPLLTTVYQRETRSARSALCRAASARGCSKGSLALAQRQSCASGGADVGT